MDKNLKLGTFFNLSEFTYSDTAIMQNIDNMPTKEHVSNMIKLVKEILDPLRHIVGKIEITSGYRSAVLNDFLKGVPNSAHLTGCAADIFHPDLENTFELIKNDFIYDQVILESKDTKKGKVFWIHVSYVEGKNRGQSFKMHNGKVISPIVANKRWN